MRILIFLIVIFVIHVSKYSIEAIGSSNYYNVLGIDSKATDQQIKKAFRKLVLKYHPDKNPAFEDKFREIAKAYEILSNPKKRKQYDDYGSEGKKNSQHSQFAFNFNFDDVMMQFDQQLGEFGHKFHTPTNKMDHKKTESIFNFDHIFNDEDMFQRFEFDNLESMFGSKDDLQYQDGRGASCNTVTQNIGNMVTTYTQCS